MKKCLLGIAMLLTAGFSFAQQETYTISPSASSMEFDIDDPAATDKVVKEFSLMLNVPEVENYRSGLCFITIPEGLQLVSYSTRTEVWHQAAGAFASGELQDPIVSSEYDKEHNVLKVAFTHATADFGVPFELSEPICKFKAKLTSKLVIGEQNFLISENHYPVGYVGEDTRMVLVKMDDTEIMPQETETPIELKAKLTVGASGYATLCWPGALDFAGTGLTANVAISTNDGFVQREEVSKVPASTPVILSADAGSYYLKSAVENNLAAPASNILKGTADAAYTATSNTFALAQKTEGVGFYRCQAGVEIPKYKAYIEQAGSADESFLFEETTGINNVEAEADNADVYTISGVKVQNPSQKGIYIINGKKVVK